MAALSGRWPLTARILTAAVGGYALSTVITLLLLLVTGFEGREARMFTSMIFFIAYVTIVIVAFSIQSHKKTIGLIAAGNGVLWGAWYLAGGEL
ncbi:hypothetical protein [uncultured Thalassolituus sp.]|uniref:hypothetical protein n=1 Tax=uncultured Thalassolituus sp. TaxID=285273 RepID=UPI0026049822|nr:hypothetical protein [uncultured Thalassolituus sp.]